MNEDGSSNWNTSNIENLNKVNNQNQQRQNNTRNWAAQHRRRRRDIAVVASIAYLTLEPRISMHNNILSGWLKVEEYLWDHPKIMFNRLRKTLQVFTVLCMLLKKWSLLANSWGLVVEEQFFMFLTIISQSENSRATQYEF